LDQFIGDYLKKMPSIVKLITLPTVVDDGFLTFGQTPDIPFDIKRLYYIYDCTPGLPRGAHAHHNTQQILFCLRGKVTISVDNGNSKEEVILDKPNLGIFLDKMIWHDMINIEKDTFMLVVASLPYQKEDYIRDYQEFIKLTNGQ